MANKFFLHQIRVGKTTTSKGVVIHDTLDDAKQGYHAYLGAYVYGHDPDAIFVEAMITDIDNSIYLRDSWKAAEEEQA